MLKYFQNVENCSIFSHVTFHFWKSVLFYCHYSYIRLFWTSNRWFSKRKSKMWKNWTVFNILVIFELILKVLHLNFSELVSLMHLYWQKNSKINKTSNSLCNFAFKTIGLTPGTVLGCFQSSQDIVYLYVSCGKVAWKV